MKSLIEKIYMNFKMYNATRMTPIKQRYETKDSYKLVLFIELHKKIYCDKV